VITEQINDDDDDDGPLDTPLIRNAAKQE